VFGSDTVVPIRGKEWLDRSARARRRSGRNDRHLAEGLRRSGTAGVGRGPGDLTVRLLTTFSYGNAYRTLSELPSTAGVSA
jgi:hypothetical protein